MLLRSLPRFCCGTASLSLNHAAKRLVRGYGPAFAHARRLLVCYRTLASVEEHEELEVPASALLNTHSSRVVYQQPIDLIWAERARASGQH